MARLLLIDEMQTTRDSLADVLRRQGHQVDTEATPEGGEQIVRSNPPDAIFLAGRGASWSSVRALEQLRTAATGATSPPIVWMDGSPPDFAGKAPDAFVARSPVFADVQKVLGVLLGGGGPREWADLPFLHGISGPLETYPPIRVLALAHRLKATGRMSIVTDSGRIVIDLDAGRVVNVVGFPNLLEFLGIANGPDDDLGQVLGRAVSAGMAADSALNIAARTIGARLAELLGEDGHVEFDAQARPKVAPVVLPVTVPRMLTEGLKETRSAEKMASVYAGYKGARVEISAPQGVPLEQLGLDPVAFRLLRKAQKVHYLDLLLKAEEGDAEGRLLAVDLLVQLGYLALRPSQGQAPSAEGHVDESEEITDENAPALDSDKTGPTIARDGGARDAGKGGGPKKPEDPRLVELRATRDRFRSAYATEILGIEDGADLAPDALSKKYREASQRHHPDKYSMVDGKALRMVADDIIALVNQAYETLKDPALMEEAKSRLDARKGGKVFVSKREKNQAKLCFAKGEIHYRARRWVDAYEELTTAARLDPEAWRYKALQLQAGFWGEKLTAREASEGMDIVVKRLTDEDADKNANQVADLLFQVGEIWIRAGDEPRAYRFFERAKSANPKHPATLRRLWLKQVREDGKATPPPSTRETAKLPPGKKGDAQGGALAGIMGLFGKKK